DTIEIYTGAKFLNVKDVGFRYYDHNVPVQKAFDPAHFWVQLINADFRNSYMKSFNFEGTVEKLSFSEKKGTELKSFEGRWEFNKTGASINNMNLQFNQTSMAGDLEVRYPSLKAISQQPDLLYFDIDLEQSTISWGDVLYFQPALKGTVPYLGPADKISLSTNMQGRMDQIEINHLNVQGLNATQLTTGGVVKGLPEIQQTYFDLKPIHLVTGRKDIKKIIADTLLPANVTIPKNIEVKMAFNGRMNEFKTDAVFKTSLGNLSFKGNLAREKDSVLTYDGHLDVNKLQLGKVINNDSLGMVSLVGDFTGRGITLETVNTEINLQVSQVNFNSYAYHNIDMCGIFREEQFMGELDFADPNLALDFDGIISLNDSVPRYRFTLDLEKADLQALNLSNQDIKTRFLLKADIQTGSLNQVDGVVDMKHITISKDNAIYQIDTLSLIASTDSSFTDIQFISPILDASLKGDFDINTIDEVFVNHFNYYFETEQKSKTSLQPHSFAFNVNIKNPDFIKDVVVTGLTEFVPGAIEGSYNSAKKQLDVDINIPRLVYQGTVVDSLKATINADEDTLQYQLTVDEIVQSGFNITNVMLGGGIENDRVGVDLKVYDQDMKKQYHLAGLLSRTQGDYYFNLKKEPLINYESWEVNPENQLIFGNNNIWVENFVLRKHVQKIKIDSKINNEQDTLLTAQFNQFGLDFLGEDEETNQLILSGILDGQIDYNMSRNSSYADVKFTDFSYLGDTLGTIDLQARNRGAETNLDVKVRHKINEMYVTGKIVQDQNTNLDLKVDLSPLNLATIEAYTGGALDNMSGTLKGALDITGTLEEPDINGSLLFNQAAFVVDYTGERYFIDNSAIKFNQRGIAFDNFAIRDSDKKNLTVKGNILTADYANFDLNLKLEAEDFQLLNTEKEDNELFYGKLHVTSSVDVRGTLKNPVIRTDLTLENSDFTYVIPETKITVAQRKGVVEFFDADVENDPFFNKEVEEKDTTEMWVSGIDLIANISIVNSSNFNVVIDPITQDRLAVSGDANLTLTMKPAGDMTLTGRYEVNEGYYKLNFYGIAKREFNITKGSYLLWTGDPFNAQLNVTASYSVKATPIDEEVRQKIPFIVYLDIKDQLISPDISFRLALEEEGAAPLSVQSWVSNVNRQESLLNQQVFSLILFKSFMARGQGASGDSDVAQSTARNSVSRILTNQLNKLGRKIKGVELSFDLESYQDYDESGSTVGRTQLELGLSKQFFDDRVIVKVAGNFDLEGSEGNQRSASDFAGDIQIEYKLTEDGRFRLVGFRENEYDNLL
ncbi:MAG: translocation/assembly module TamB domain-containing protein, partial [Fulvivirga sp.]|nr:translocation/assembly module TamB domain-containing protein [Fulvivirga sp.]